MSGRLTPGERSSRLDRPFQAALIARFPSTLLHPCPPHQQTLTTPPTPPQTHNKLHKRDSPPQNTHTAAVGGASAQDPTTPPSPPPSPPRPRPSLLNLAIFSCARTPPTPPYLTHHPPLRLPPACSRPHAAREDSDPSTHRPPIQHLATPHRPPTHLPLRRRAALDDAILPPRAEPPDAAAWEGGATSEGRLHAAPSRPPIPPPPLSTSSRAMCTQTDTDDLRALPCSPDARRAPCCSRRRPRSSSHRRRQRDASDPAQARRAALHAPPPPAFCRPEPIRRAAWPPQMCRAGGRRTTTRR